MFFRFAIRPVVLASLISTFVASIASADDALYFGIHRSYESPRALGMGNAIVAAADDYTALFLNPAFLARREQGQLNLSIEISAAQNIATLMDDVSKAQKTEGSDTDKQRAILEVISDSYGKNFSVRTAPLSAVLVRPDWGMAFIPMDLFVNFSIHNQLGPSINAVAYADSTLAFGFADDLQWGQHGRLSMGTTFKMVNRGFFSKSVNSFELVDNSEIIDDSDMREGSTIDADVGFLYTPVLPASGFFSAIRLAKPTFGLVVRNVLDYGFTSDLNLLNKKDHDVPEKLYRRIDIGSKWEYPQAWLFSGRGVMDFRDLLHPNVTFKKSMHVGFEFDWRVSSWWKGAYRFGLNQGYSTLGASALLGIFNLDLVTYGEEVGTAAHPVESRVYMAKLNLDF